MSCDAEHQDDDQTAFTSQNAMNLQFIILTGVSAVALRYITPPRTKVGPGAAAMVQIKRFFDSIDK